MNNTDLKKLINFIEELSWVLKSYKDLEVNELLNEIKLNQEIRNSLVHNKNLSHGYDDKSRLIGILPGLLNDKKLFSLNSDLIEFAESAFEINITRPEKRSRYEIIGLIIMELFESKNTKVLGITDSIQKLANNTRLKNKLRRKKNSSNFSWNKAIREITNQ